MQTMASISEAIADKAIEWAKLGVQFRHRGMSRNGCDCTGLFIGIARELNLLKKFVLRPYKIDWNLHSGASDIITRELDLVSDKIEKHEVKKGDIVVFRFAKCDSHLGLYIENGLFVHCLIRQKVGFGMLRNSQWSKRWSKTYRFNEEKMSKYK